MYRTFCFVVVAFLAGVSVSQADTFGFTYGYNTVYDSNANQHVVSQQNVMKYNEGQGVTYYCPSSVDAGCPSYC